MSSVEVVVAGPQQRVVFENLMQLYTHDFSEQWYDRPTGEVDERAAFPTTPSTRTGASRTTCRCCCASTRRSSASHCSTADTHQPPARSQHGGVFRPAKHRRSGAGTAAAQAIFSRYPGMWEAAIARRNVAALAFWRRAIGEHPLSQHIEEIDVSTPGWNGPVLRFRIRAGRRPICQLSSRGRLGRRRGGSDALPESPRPRTAPARSPG